MLAAAYYDGRSTHRHAVRISFCNGQMHIDGEGLHRRMPIELVDFGEPLQGAPRSIELPDGARCEVADETTLASHLAAVGVGDSFLVRVQRRWYWALGALLLVIAGAASGYFWVLPTVARELAPKVPQTLVRALSDSVLAQLDRRGLEKSRLPEARQEEIRQRLATILSAPGTTERRLHFRHAPRHGANALALPGGEIIILDRLVTLLDGEHQLEAVVAHEIGHLEHHHAMRQLIQQTTVSIAIAAWFGDVSSVAVATSGQLLKSGYSREAEMEADAYAARQMLLCCGSVEPLISALRKLEKHNPHGDSPFATHPEAAKRIAAIRGSMK